MTSQSTVASRRMATAWLISAGIHALIGLFLFLWPLSRTSPRDPAAEILVMSVPSTDGAGVAARAQPFVGPPSPVSGPLRPSASSRREPASPSSPVDPPMRGLNTGDDALDVTRRSRIAPGGRGGGSPSGGLTAGTERRDRTQDRGGGGLTGIRERPGIPGAGTVSSGTSPAMPDLVWIGGGTRRKLSGELPNYPKGVSVEAKIRVEAVVRPDGTVRSVRPVQKGNAALENAAMAAVRGWTFEPLPASLPRKEQACIVTFLFTLR